jgi:nicotinate-nucleotide pyrophosphorylase (carboxylating)
MRTVRVIPFLIRSLMGYRVEWSANEGDYLNPNAEGKIAIAHVHGKARHLLLGERIALNIISRCSGIALK